MLVDVLFFLHDDCSTIFIMNVMSEIWLDMRLKNQPGIRDVESNTFLPADNNGECTVCITDSLLDLFESISPGSCGYIENILPVLHNSYMNPESAKCFSYNHAYLVKNDVLLEKFNFSYVEKKKKGYKPEELEESFGFLLCEQENQAKQLCETGLKVGNSSCSTLGDPTKGVYISKYSDCLDLKPWHNGKSGCIVIFRLIKGRVKAVTENYTANFPKPSVGYDCHVSEKIGTISSTSSSFQAYESTQYYIYELQNGEAVSCPRHICPFAIVGFLYSESKSSTSVLKNGKKPEKLKVDSVMKVCDLKKALPEAAFKRESYCTSEDMKAPYFVRKSEDLISRDVMQILPALNYAEMKAEKFQTDQKTPPCELVEQHLHNYATLTRPGITDSSPIRDLFPLAEQYDVSRVDKHLYRTAKCPKSAVANLKSYFSGSDAYVLPVSKALELLAVYQNEACEDADDDCEIICYSPVSSPEAEQHMCWNEGDLDDQIRTLESGNASSHEHDIHKEGKGLEMAIHEAQGGDTERMEITGAQGTDQQDALSNKNIFKILKTRDNKMPSDSSKDSRGKRKKPVLPVGPKTEGPSKNSNGNNIEKRRKPMASLDQQGTDKKERSSKRLTRNSGGNGKKLLDSDDQIHPKGTTTGDELHPLKRKMKGESYRYGLKNIVTDCGRVFVPHGSKVLHTDLIPTEQTTGAEGECKTHLCKEDSLASGADSELTRSVTESFHNALDRIAPSEPEIQKESEQPKDTQVKENELMDALKKLPPCKTNAGRGVDSVKKQKTLAPADQVVALIDSKETPTTDKPSSPKRKKQNDGNRENCELENVGVNFEKSVSPQSVQALITDSKSLEPTIGSEERPTTKKYQRKRPAGEAESSKSTKTMEETKNSNRRGKKPLAPADQKVSVIDPIENNIVDGLSPLPSIQQPKKVTKRRIVKERVNFQTRIAEYMKENVNGILQVTREWKESYEFALDSKYSNDPLDKCVTRALHGPWNFNIEETFEQVHLILHMWIGLFYSKSTLRFFQTDTVQSSDQSKCIFQISPSRSVTQRAPPAGSCDSQIKHLQVPSVIQKAVKEPDMEVLDRGEQSNEALDLTETNYEALDLTVPKNTKNMVPHSTSELVPSETPEESWVSNYSGSRNEDVNYTQLQDTTTAKAWSTPGKYSDKDCRADAELHKEMEDEEEDEDDNTGVSYMYPTRFLDTDKEYIELCNKATSLCIAKGKPYNGVQRTLIDDWMKRIALVAVPVNERTTKRTCIQTEKLVHIYTTDPECKEKKMCKKDEKSCNLTAALRTEKDNTISETMETITNSGGTVAVMHSDNGEDVNMQSPKELLDRNDNQKDKCLSVPEVNENILPDESVVEQKMHRENESSCNSTAVPRTEKENTISEPTETVGNSGEAVAAMHSENGEAISVQSRMMEQLLERNENQRQAILSDTEAKDSLSSDESVMEQNMCRENESSWILTEAPRSEKDDNFSEPTETVGNSSGTVAVMHSEHGEDIGNQNSQMDEFLDGNENQSEGILSDPEVYEDISSDESVVAQKICIENEISWIIVAIPRREKENTISEPTETITNYGGTVAVMDSENGEDINIQSPTIEQLLDRNENQKDECLPVSEVKENLLPDESVVEQKMHRENESSWILTKAPKSEKDDNISEPTETITDSGGTLAVLHSENGEAVHLQSPMIEQKLLERNENQREAILSDTEVKDSLLPDGSVIEQNMCRENESSWILTEAPRSKKDDNISEPTETVVNSDGAVAVMHSEHGEDIGNQSSHMDAFLDGNENQREEILSDPEVHEDISSDESVVDSKEKGSQLSNKPAHDYGACCWYSEFETDCVPVSQGRKEDLCGDSEEASSVVCSAVLDQNPAFTKTQTELVGNVDENEGSIKLHISNRGKQHTSRTYLQNMMDVDSLPISSVVHITDCWGSQKTYANFSIVKPRENVCARTVQNAQKENWQLKGFNFLKAWEEMHYTKPDLTQNTLDREYLCFSDKLNQITKRNKHTDLSEASHANGRAFSPLTITFSDLDVVPDSLQTTDLPLRNHQITVDMPQRTAIQEANKMNEFGDNVTLPHLKKLTYVKDMREQQCEISDITTKCFQSHMSSMNHVCNGKRKELDLGTTSTDSQKRNKDFLQSSTRKPLPFQKVIDHLCTDLHQNLNAVVKESFKTKFKFYIIETKIDEFFENIKKILKKEGHAEVQLSYFDQPDEHPSGPLIVIIRNEDISTHVHRIPHLVDLKKVPSVLFAGIDSIDDVLSFNYQELFNRGGFVVCDGAVLESLELEHLKEIVNVLEELNQQGRWKWWLHYKDSKMLKENGRTVSPGHAKKFFMDCCQEAGIVEVLPYHECDLISQGKPEYLNCMLRLQVQHITARFAVFITDKADESYGNNGVLAMDINTFLTHFKTFQY
ncbi:hypothetical protein EOD39_3980 [Acipenser ruthenus]|uniref:Uncharacterized protein n=1 Tax=Acipenser ruthenus TaxID=7906 RepID=A0A444UKD1_ACIRT|nr:hypothetical protein EOD39_3980 [Acipenser ruthenus]